MGVGHKRAPFVRADPKPWARPCGHVALWLGGGPNSQVHKPASSPIQGPANILQPTVVWYHVRHFCMWWVSVILPPCTRVVTWVVCEGCSQPGWASTKARCLVHHACDKSACSPLIMSDTYKCRHDIMIARVCDHQVVCWVSETLVSRCVAVGDPRG